MTEHVRGFREPITEVDPLDPDMVTAFVAACPTWWGPCFTGAFWTGKRGRGAPETGQEYVFTGRKGAC